MREAISRFSSQGNNPETQARQPPESRGQSGPSDTFCEFSFLLPSAKLGRGPWRLLLSGGSGGARKRYREMSPGQPVSPSGHHSTLHTTPCRALPRPVCSAMTCPAVRLPQMLGEFDQRSLGCPASAGTPTALESALGHVSRTSLLRLVRRVECLRCRHWTYGARRTQQRGRGSRSDINTGRPLGRWRGHSA